MMMTNIWLKLVHACAVQNIDAARVVRQVNDLVQALSDQYQGHEKQILKSVGKQKNEDEEKRSSVLTAFEQAVYYARYDQQTVEKWEAEHFGGQAEAIRRVLRHWIQECKEQHSYEFKEQSAPMGKEQLGAEGLEYLWLGHASVYMIVRKAVSLSGRSSNGIEQLMQSAQMLTSQAYPWLKDRTGLEYLCVFPSSIHHDGALHQWVIDGSQQLMEQVWSQVDIGKCAQYLEQNGASVIGTICFENRQDWIERVYENVQKYGHEKLWNQWIGGAYSCALSGVQDRYTSWHHDQERAEENAYDWTQWFKGKGLHLEENQWMVRVERSLPNGKRSYAPEGVNAYKLLESLGFQNVSARIRSEQEYEYLNQKILNKPIDAQEKAQEPMEENTVPKNKPMRKVL